MDIKNNNEVNYDNNYDKKILAFQTLMKIQLKPLLKLVMKH